MENLEYLGQNPYRILSIVLTKEDEGGKKITIGTIEISDILRPKDKVICYN